MKKIRTCSVSNIDTKEFDGILSNAINSSLDELKITPENLIDIKINSIYDHDGLYEDRLHDHVIEIALIIYLKDIQTDHL